MTYVGQISKILLRQDPFGGFFEHISEIWKLEMKLILLKHNLTFIK